MRAYGALRANDREVSLRAWLYRVAHNRCIDQLRRPAPPPPEMFELSRAAGERPDRARPSGASRCAASSRTCAGCPSSSAPPC